MNHQPEHDPVAMKAALRVHDAAAAERMKAARRHLQAGAEIAKKLQRIEQQKGKKR